MRFLHMRSRGFFVSILFLGIFLFKISSAFAVVPVLNWARIFASFDAHKVDFANGIAVRQSSLFVVGNTGEDFNGDGENDIDDYRIVWYDTSGNQLSAFSYDSGGLDVAYAVATEPAGSGSVYVTGYSFNPARNNLDFRTLKYGQTLVPDVAWNSNPQTLFNGRADGLGDDTARGIAVGPNGDVYVAGYNSYAGAVDYQVVRYASSTGNEVWRQFYDGGGTDMAYGIAVDSQNNAIVTGASFSSGTGNLDFRTLKLASSTGQILWNRTYNEGWDDEAFGVAVDRPTGNVYVSGYSGALGVARKWTVVKYDAAGTLIWNKSGSTAEYANGVAVDLLGDPYVTGSSIGGVTPFDFRAIKYASSTGNELWNRTFDSGAFDYANAIAVDDSQRVYLTGTRHIGGFATGDDDMLTVKYGALAGSGPACGVALSSIQWTDTVITPNTTKIRYLHTTELRAWINNQRQDVGLSNFTFTDTNIFTASFWKIRAVHFNEMRTAISGVYTACSQPTPTFTDPVLTSGVTKIRAVHLTDLRSAAQNAP